MARKRKVGRPKGSKNKKKTGRKSAARSSKAKSKKAKSRKRGKATPKQLAALKKAWTARKLQLKKAKKKAGKKKGKATAKQLAALKLARAARELKNMPKTLRMHAEEAMAATVRNPHPTSMPSILMRVRRRPVAKTMFSTYN